MQNPEERPRTIQTIQLEDSNRSFSFVSDGNNFSATRNLPNQLTFLLDLGATDNIVNELDAFTNAHSAKMGR